MVRLVELNQAWRAQCINYGFHFLEPTVPQPTVEIDFPDTVVDEIVAIANGLQQQGGVVVVSSLYFTGNNLNFPYAFFPHQQEVAGGGA